MWGRKDPDAAEELDGGFEETLIVEVPADAAVMELTLQGSKLMRAAIERQRAAQEMAAPRM